MKNSSCIIPPRLTLPMKPQKQEKRNFSRDVFVRVLLEGIYLFLAVSLGYSAFHYLATWPVYRIVAFVVLFILWSNCASSVIRKKTPQQQTRELLHGVHSKKQEMTTDTTMYLTALKKDFLRK